MKTKINLRKHQYIVVLYFVSKLKIPASIICTFYDPKEYFGDYISIFLEIWLTSSAFMYIIESWKTK